MKIFETINTKEADKITIERQGITYYQLMQRAAGEVFWWLKNHFADRETTFHFFCGQGNNGGDGLVVAKLLHKDNYRVFVNVVEEAGKPTEEFLTAKEELEKTDLKINTRAEYMLDRAQLVFVDAIFGLGLNREMPEEVKSLIKQINNDTRAIRVSIDVPSGLFMDKGSTFAVKSDYVLTFQFPKLAFYLHGNKDFVNHIEILDIGLDKEYINNTPTGLYLTDNIEARKKYRPVAPYAHKGTQGHAVIIGGSYGKIGAVCLSAKAALKSGCGLVTAYLPKCGYTIIQSYFPEAMALTNGEEYIEAISFDVTPKAIGLGPGIGQHPDTQQAIYNFLKNNHTPLVIDADALNILAQHKEWLSLLPENTILTPHPKEMERLIGSWQNDFERIAMMKAFSHAHNIILVAKDAHTMIVEGNTVFVNPTGNAALATGGTGDVLTGIITGLLAQGYPPADAAIFGVYLHGHTADIASGKTSIQAFTASDCIDNIGKSYLAIEKIALKK
ncbi:NAD(P)H-hydrate dehydratase [Flavobacterium rhizosphaerae]|uniref:Bifunctional NAD(P)H-hydrate repair enzyme n=1 Tax=Flavobacterium rhizosphaerae TaxID=3163298 RepID=A0ABW8YVD9_9FLAO